MEKITLGGERLGSGKKMKVGLHGYGRSNHDLSSIFRNTQSAGTLVPFMKHLGLPGDTFDIKLVMEALTLPTTGPLFGSYKLGCDVYVCPIRLYQGQLHNNKLGIGLKMADIKLPQITVAVNGQTVDESLAMDDLDNSQVNPSSIVSYLGIRGAGIPHSSVSSTQQTSRQFNAVPYLAYWDIFKNYYANKQEDKAYVVHTPAIEPSIWVSKIDLINVNEAALSIPLSPNASNILVKPWAELVIEYLGNNEESDNLILELNGIGKIAFLDVFTLYKDDVVNKMAYYVFNANKWGNVAILNYGYIANNSNVGNVVKLKSFDLKNIDDMREDILSQTQNPNPFTISQASIEPYNLPFINDGTYRSMMFCQEGLAVKTYQSDIFNNWLKTENIVGANSIAEVTSIDTSGGSFSIDTLNLSKKVYEMLTRIAVSGGTYNDWISSVYDSKGIEQFESPMYCGGLIKELVFQEVISNAESETGGNVNPLGTLGGRGVLSKKNKGGDIRISIKEPSYIIGICHITPRLDYSQGNDWDVNLKTIDDFHKPQLDEIGFQDLITERMAWWETYQDQGGSWVQRSAGKQPAWIEYMTDVNRVRGNFAMPNNQMFMILNRRYEPAKINNTLSIKDLTTYIDPSKYNHIFAQTSLDSMNFWLQIGMDITARRVMSGKLMPNI